jgi:branched-chain amino acid transport system permease protein
VDQVLVFLLLGIGSGALISGAGIGVVLSYRGSGLINLSVGAFSMLGGYCFYSLRSGFFGPKLATVPAVVATLVFAVAVGIIFEAMVIYPVRNATPLAKLVASLGFLIAAMAGVTIVFGSGPLPQPSIVPDHLFHLFGQPLLLNRFLIAAVILVVALVIVCLYRFTRFGLGTRAASENELHAALVGLSPRWLSLSNTVLMSVTMAVLGLLAASIQVLDTTDLPLLVVPGLAAALFGRLSSLVTTFVAGTIIGALQSILLYAQTLSWFPNQGFGNPLPGVSELLTFVILVIAVVVRGGTIPSRGEVIERRLPAAPRPRAPLRNAAIYGTLGVIGLVVFPGLFKISLITSMIWGTLLCSIVLITGYLGQVSAVQLALGGVAGFATGELTKYWHIAFPFAPILGVIVAAAFGFLLGIPALRVRGVSLVIVTLAAAVALSDFVFSNNSIAGGGGFVTVPKWFGFVVEPAAFAPFSGQVPSTGFALLVLGVLIAVALFVANVRTSHLGQEMLAVRANERAAAAVGINVRNVKLIGFTLAAAIAGVAGVFLSYGYGVVGLGQTDTVTMLTLIAFAYIGGITTIPGAILGGLLLTGNLVTVCLQQWFGVQPTWISLAAGLGLIAVLVWLPEGIGGAATSGRLRIGRLLPSRRVVEIPAPVVP